MDCEMVGVGQRDKSVLARVSIVNFHGQQIYDSYVRPLEPVTNWRTFVSGIQPKHMAGARSMTDVQEEISKIIKDRILVGHALQNDFKALMFSHPHRDIRDTSRHIPFRMLYGGRPPALKKLTKELLGIEIQGGEHSSVSETRGSKFFTN
jgi:RNA exonuclease 4